jgi:hypothetical protein
MTNDQAARIVNRQLRVRAMGLRAMYGLILDDVSAYKGDLKLYFEPASPAVSTWTDDRTDVNHNVTANDVAAFEAFELQLVGLIAQNLGVIGTLCPDGLDISVPSQA